MNPVIITEHAKVFHGSNLDVLPHLPNNSVDAIVTDPPYELGFMGKKWDNSGIAYSVELWTECLRVLKPGGHLLSFGGTRTWHRVAVAIEDAGFEVRDSIAWLYGSGFPKSMDVSKAIDKAAGVEREVVGTKIATPKGISSAETRSDIAAGAFGGKIKEIDITVPATAEAQQWHGWGTALKPAFEPVVVARKPLIGTVAANVLEYGTGALNIDGSRIGTESVTINTFDNGAKPFGGAAGEAYTGRESVGRWPANIILDEHTAQLLDEQSGTSRDGVAVKHNSAGNNIFSNTLKPTASDHGYGGTGGASRFFYVAKASKRDRNEGLNELEPQRHSDRQLTDGVGGNNPRNRTNEAKQNFHPTVKPTTLMQYLITLVTPPGGTILDPFTGSGSTGKAAILSGFNFIGIELTDEYLPIIQGRLEHAEHQALTETAETLF